MANRFRANAFSTGLSGFAPSPAVSARWASIPFAVLILAGCNLTPAEKREMADRHYRDTYDLAYRDCMYGVTGPFGSASFDVMKECQRQATTAAERENAHGL